MITVVSVSMAVQLVCISFFFKAQEHWECLSRKAPELRCMWALGGLLGPSFTGWSGHSGVWACRATPHGLAGKTPPTGSSQWTVCDHHPDCRIAPLHHPPTVKYAHIHTQEIGDLLDMRLRKFGGSFWKINKENIDIQTVDCTHR